GLLSPGVDLPPSCAVHRLWHGAVHRRATCVGLLRAAYRRQSRQDDRVVPDGGARSDRGGPRRCDHSAGHYPMPGADEAGLAEQGALRAGGGGDRRADQARGYAGVAWPQAEPPALAEARLAAAVTIFKPSLGYSDPTGAIAWQDDTHAEVANADRRKRRSPSIVGSRGSGTICAGQMAPQ